MSAGESPSGKYNEPANQPEVSATADESVQFGDGAADEASVEFLAELFRRAPPSVCMGACTHVVVKVELETSWAGQNNPPQYPTNHSSISSSVRLTPIQLEPPVDEASARLLKMIFRIRPLVFLESDRVWFLLERTTRISSVVRAEVILPFPRKNPVGIESPRNGH